MPLRPLSYADARRKLIAAGFSEVGQQGSHVKFAKAVEGGTRTAVLPKHREVSTGTLRSVLRQAGISAQEWEGL